MKPTLLLCLLLPVLGRAQKDAGGGPAAGESFAACQAALGAQTQAMNAACCSDPAHCTNMPSTCSPVCAAVFAPIAAVCQEFFAGRMPNLIDFGTQCSHTLSHVALSCRDGGAAACHNGGHCTVRQKPSRHRNRISQGLS